MGTNEINVRYQALVSEFYKVQKSIHAGFLSTTEAAIAVADLRGRMINLQRMAGDDFQLTNMKVLTSIPYADPKLWMEPTTLSQAR
ncbi:MAG: hypothetical protein ISR45_08795 [Rhodospirillales bacterium]|nr:hypothetical protein [Rhodospirillales bacterium]